MQPLKLGALVGCFVTALVVGVPARPSEPAPQAAIQPAGDGVTETPVTLERDEVTLEGLLGDLGQRSGLKLSAGQECRWDQVSLRVHDRPAARVKAELAKLLNYTWEGNEGRHRLHQDVGSSAYEQKLRRDWFGGAVDEL